MKSRTPNLLSLSLSAMQMGLEAQQVISLRMAKAAMGGPAAAKEAALMVSEKTEAAFQAQSLLATAWLTGTGGSAPARTLTLYRRKIRANRRRLLKA